MSLVEMTKLPPMQFDVGVAVNKQGKPAIDCKFSVPRLLNTSASLTAEASISSLIAHSLNLQYGLPLGGSWQFLAEAVKQVNDLTYASSFTESVQGLRLSWLMGRRHVLGLDAYLRDIHPVVGGKLSASEQLRRVQLRTIKTSINYKYLVDQTVRKSDQSPHPVGGYKLSLFSDIAGLFGDVRFMKFDSSFSYHRKLTDGVILHSRIGAGAIASLPGGVTPIQDRFFLGGTNDELTCMRGFATRAVGPAGKRIGTGKKSEKLYDHLGGDMYVSLDNVVSFPLYTNNGQDIRGMVFGQLGSLAPTLHSRVGQDLIRGVRASVGIGALVPIGTVGTLELTLGKPVYGRTASDTSQSLQIGIRISNVR